MPALVNPRSVLLREPNLLVPGRKPVGPVRIDWEHPLAEGLVFYYLRGADIVNNEHPQFKNGAVDDPTNGVVLDGVDDYVIFDSPVNISSFPVSAF
ncbi:MAG: hypothetical protein D6698_15575, partial [Gammaproteobacteria bacterium]